MGPLGDADPEWRSRFLKDQRKKDVPKLAFFRSDVLSWLDVRRVSPCHGNEKPR